MAEAAAVAAAAAGEVVTDVDVDVTRYTTVEQEILASSGYFVHSALLPHSRFPGSL